MAGNNEYGSFGGQMSANVDYGGQQPELGTSPLAPRSASASAPAAAGPVKDISTAEFMSEVIEASKQLPVLVDFWAPWCGPCRQLGPAIESAVAKAGGKVKLVKMNIDDHPEVAGQMGIQSIPAVVAFVGGQPKDAFMGAKPEGEIAKFIEKLVGPTGASELEDGLEVAAKLMSEKQYEQAGQLYSMLVQKNPESIEAMAGLGMAHLELDNIEAAKQIAETFEGHEDNPSVKALNSALELRAQAENLGDLAGLQALVEENPKNHQARFDLALALNAHGKREEAADQLLEIVARDRGWNEDGAREQLLKFFEAWGPMDEATLAARRRLSSLLFS